MSYRFLQEQRTAANVVSGGIIGATMAITGLPFIVAPLAVASIVYSAETTRPWLDVVLEGAEYALGYYAVELMFRRFSQ